MKSYVVTRLSLSARLNEAKNLYLNHTRNVKQNVSVLITQAREAEEKLSQLLGRPITNLKMLEIGPGQQLVQLSYFGRHNEIVGIDFDSVPQGMNIATYAQMFSENGWLRTSKTIARKVVGIDSLVRSETLRQLDIEAMPRCKVLKMDAAKMAFPDESFDAVISRAVFEHLSDPAAVASEIRRVLKPGGAVFVNLHLYTSDSGCHDTRIFLGDRGKLPFWSHLREEHMKAVRPNSYLNKLRLAEWRRIFESTLPGCDVVACQDAGNADKCELAKLRAQGALPEYSDEELLTVTLEAMWRKPLTEGSAPSSRGSGNERVPWGLGSNGTANRLKLIFLEIPCMSWKCD
jgi:SAM-dependent methyltransferase